MDELLKTAVKACEEKLAEHITVLDFRNVSPICDYFVICDVDNNRKLLAVCDNVEDRLAEAGYDTRIEGDKDSSWILIDAHDVCVHVFLRENRAFYNLEKLWMDVPRVNPDEIV